MGPFFIGGDILFLDNLTGLPEWLSDALCRCSTGEGFSKRELFTDDEDVFYSFQRCQGINGINMVASKADLLDRSLIFSFERISDEKRMDEHEFYRRFNADLPYILQGLFDTFSMAITYIDDINLTSKPRMADFAKWGCAIARALGYTEQSFLDAYYENIGLQNEEAIDASPIAKAIIAYMDGKKKEMMPSSELLKELEKAAEILGIDIKSKHWPKDSRWLWRRIKEVKPNLSAVGIEAEHNRDEIHKTITLRVLKNDGSNGSNGRMHKNQCATPANIPANINTSKNDGRNDDSSNIQENQGAADTADTADIFQNVEGTI